MPLCALLVSKGQCRFPGSAPTSCWCTGGMWRWRWLDWPRSAGGHTVGLPPVWSLAEVVFCSRSSTVPSMVDASGQKSSRTVPLPRSPARLCVGPPCPQPPSALSFGSSTSRGGTIRNLCCPFGHFSSIQSRFPGTQQLLPYQTPPASRGLQAVRHMAALPRAAQSCPDPFLNPVAQ